VYLVVGIVLEDRPPAGSTRSWDKGVVAEVEAYMRRPNCLALAHFAPMALCTPRNQLHAALEEFGRFVEWQTTTTKPKVGGRSGAGQDR
jgi:hypothetical protein